MTDILSARNRRHSRRCCTVQKCYPLQRQRGMATLMFALVLLTALVLISFASARTLLLEQSLSGNEYRSRELHHAAEAALEYGIGWLQGEQPDFARWNAVDLNSSGEAFDDLNSPETVLSSGRDSYRLQVFYTRVCRDGSDPAVLTDIADCARWLIELEGRAVAVSDPDLQRRHWLKLLQSDSNGDGITEFIRLPGSWRDWPVTP